MYNGQIKKLGQIVIVVLTNDLTVLYMSYLWKER